MRLEEKKVTWAEVATHNTPQSAWLIIDSNVYDVTKFLDSHPGGRDMLLHAAGRDVTDVFYSYHKDSTKTQLKKYQIEGMRVTEHEYPQYPRKTQFYDKLKARMWEYCRQKKIDPRYSPVALFHAAWILLSVCLLTYATFYVPWQNFYVPLALAVCLGTVHHLSLVKIYHDVSHGALTNSPLLWRLLGWTADVLVGHSIWVWTTRHSFGHHVWTNVLGVDPDIGEKAEKRVYRTCAKQPYFSHYRFQKYYQPFVYGLVAFKMQWDDIASLQTGRLGDIRVNFTTQRKRLIAFFKLLYVLTKVVLPCFFLPVWKVIALFLIYDITAGYWFGILSQVSHVTTETMWPDTPFNDDWAVLQIRTAQDYGHGNWLCTFLNGALNYQVIHHLYPSVSQEYYPALAEIVKRTCREYKVPYPVLSGFSDAFSLHVRHLELLGTPEVGVKDETVPKKKIP